MSHNFIMFLYRNKKIINTFLLKKMPYLGYDISKYYCMNSILQLMHRFQEDLTKHLILDKQGLAVVDPEHDNLSQIKKCRSYGKIL